LPELNALPERRRVPDDDDDDDEAETMQLSVT